MSENERRYKTYTQYGTFLVFNISIHKLAYFIYIICEYKNIYITKVKYEIYISTLHVYKSKFVFFLINLIYFWLRWVFVAVRRLLIVVASPCRARVLGARAQ